MSLLLDPPIVLSGELSLADVLAANRLLESRRPRKHQGGVRVAAASLAVALGVTVSGFEESLIVWTMGFALAAAAAIYLIPAFVNRAKLHRLWKRKEGVFRVVNTTIGPDGLTITEPHSTITVEWPHFVAALMGPNVLYLFPKEGWILFGRSRFADDRDWNRFRAFVEDRWPVAPRFM